MPQQKVFQWVDELSRRLDASKLPLERCRIEATNNLD